MAQQTAVEWYDQELRKCMMGTVQCDPIQIREQANQMFKERIIDAFGVGCQVESTRLIGYQGKAEEYYNETYNK